MAPIDTHGTATAVRKFKQGAGGVHDSQYLTCGACLQLLKSDARLWTSKYARGGSVRKPSARKIYIVVDALQGHLTSTG